MSSSGDPNRLDPNRATTIGANSGKLILGVRTRQLSTLELSGAQWSSVLTVVPTVATGPQSKKSQSLSPSACDSSCSLIKLHIPHTPSSHQLGGARSTRRTRSSTIGSAAASSVRSARGRSRLRRRKEGAAEVHRRLGSARQTCRFLEPLQGECNTRPHSVH